MHDARRVLREWRWMITLVTPTFAAVGLLFDARSPTIHAASAELELRTLTPDAPLVGIRIPKADVEPEGAAARAAGLAADPDVLRQARSELGDSVPAGYVLAGRAGAAPAAVPGRLFVTVQDEKRERAVRAANALASAIVASITATELDRFDRIVVAVRRERRRLGSSREADLATRLDQVRLERELTALATIRRVADPAGVVRPATLPGVRETTRRGRTLPALVLGMSLSIAAAFLLDAVARRPRDPRRLAAAAGMPLLGQIPPAHRHRGEPYQRVQIAVEWLGRNPPSKRVVVTSAEPAAGKSTVAVGLAGAAADAGRRVCLVECDLHRPVLASRLGLEGPGVGEWLAGEVRRSDVLREAVGFVERPIAVAAAGAPRPRPGEALAGSALDDILSSLERDHDVLIIDAPPLLAASDALGLVQHADAVVVCARAGHTSRDELAAARAALDRLAGVPPGGLVVTGAREHAPAAASAPRGRYRPHLREA